MEISFDAIPSPLTPDGSAYSGDSSDANVVDFEEPPVTQQDDSAPVLFLNWFGVPTSKIGLHGNTHPLPGRMIPYLEHRHTFPFFPFYFNFFNRRPKNLRSDQPNQVWATPGMGSVDANDDREARKELPSIATPFSASLGKDLSQFAHCYETLLKDSQSGLQNLLYIDNTGGNDLLSWDHLILPHFTTSDEFRDSLDYRFKVLAGKEALNETGQKQKIDGLTVIRFGVLPIDKVLIDINTPGAMMKKKGSKELVPVPSGSKAFLPIVWRTEFHYSVREEDVLTPGEQTDFHGYITDLREEEEKVCQKHGVVLIRIDDYVDLILQKLVYSKRCSLDQLIGDDGYHPRPPLKLLLVLARALETKNYLNYRPTQEVLDIYAQELGVPTDLLQKTFDSENSRLAFADLLGQVQIQTIPRPEFERKKAAKLFPVFFKMLRRSPQKQT